MGSSAFIPFICGQFISRDNEQQMPEDEKSYYVVWVSVRGPADMMSGSR